VIAGRVVGGFLVDRFWAPLVAFVFLSAPAAALWLLAEPQVSREGAMIAIFLIGFGAGVEYDFMAYLVARYFGTKAYGAIYGSLYGFFALGAGFAPPIIAGAVRTGPEAVYSLLHACAIALIVAAAALLLLGRYRQFAEVAPDQPASGAT
jgi:MFS family permease